MALKKTTKTQEMVRVDSTQLLFLKYVSELTGTPVAALVREAIEDWLDVSYSIRVYEIEKERGLPASTTSSGKPQDEHKAFENMLRNLKKVQDANQKRKALAAKA
jgi:predicted DNA-binding protein